MKEHPGTGANIRKNTRTKLVILSRSCEKTSHFQSSYQTDYWMFPHGAVDQFKTKIKKTPNKLLANM